MKYVRISVAWKSERNSGGQGDSVHRFEGI